MVTITGIQQVEPTRWIISYSNGETRNLHNPGGPLDEDTIREYMDWYRVTETEAIDRSC